MALFTLPFRAFIAQCFGAVKAPSPVVVITVAGKRSAVSDWHSKWPFCQRGDSDTSSPGRHIQSHPNLMRLSMLTRTNLVCFPPLLEPFPSPVE